jgi:hypothetical protein
MGAAAGVKRRWKMRRQIVHVSSRAGLMRLRSCLGMLVVSLALASSADAATLLVNGSGLLTGATGVDVGGTLYDVEFVEGSCVALFDGCDAVTDFDFTTAADVLAASQALLDQVFLDVSGQGTFDTRPSLTFGCLVIRLPVVEHSRHTGSIANSLCRVLPETMKLSSRTPSPSA